MIHLARLLVLAPVAIGEVAWSQSMTVRVWNYAGVSSETIRKAEAEVNAIFRRVDSRLDWVDCDPGHPRPDICVRTPGPGDLVLRFVHKSVSPGTPGADVLGRAMGDTVADVYEVEVDRFAEAHLVERHEVYAVAIAHELGHLLLGPGAHTPTGLMNARLGPHDFAAAARRELRFTPAQSDRIRSVILARTTFTAVPKRQSQH